jgi:glycosyltransferase involved in cell wall biosynthesis
MHLIGLKLAQKTNIPWIADFRDPWTNIDFYEDLLLTKMADRRHRWLEKQVLSQATKVLVVGNRMKLEFSELIDSSKIIVLPNGYDDDDAGKNQALVDTKFSIAHIGSFSPARNPHTLWSVLQQLCKELPGFADDLVIRAVGTVDYTVSQSLEQHELTPYLERIAYLPHHEVIQEQQRAAVLLLVVNRSKNAKGILTGKVFEYLLSTRPLLAVGPTDGDLAGLLENVGAAPVVDYDDFEGLKNRVRTLYSNFKQGIAEQAPQVERYSRSNLTRDLATLMMQLSDVKK